MKVISGILCEMNTSLKGDNGVKLLKGACFLKRHFIELSTICQVDNNDFIRTPIGLKDMH